jgi:hypothetical protein
LIFLGPSILEKFSSRRGECSKTRQALGFLVCFQPIKGMKGHPVFRGIAKHSDPGPAPDGCGRHRDRGLAGLPRPKLNLKIKQLQDKGSLWCASRAAAADYRPLAAGMHLAFLGEDCFPMG